MAADLSACCIDAAFKLLTMGDGELREMAFSDLQTIVETRLRRPGRRLAYLGGIVEGHFRAPPQQFQSVWTKARKASRRFRVLWELAREYVRLTYGDTHFLTLQ